MFVRRPIPTAQTSSKRQRVTSSNGSSLALISPLPLEVEALQHQFSAQSPHGVAQCGGLSFAWALIGTHVHLWQLAEQQSAPVHVRLNTFVESGDLGSHPCFLWVAPAPQVLSQRQDGQGAGFRNTVFLVCGTGDVFCWPLGVGSPMHHKVLLETSQSCTSFCGFSDFLAVAIGTSDGSVYICRLSENDVSLSTQRLCEHSGDDDDNALGILKDRAFSSIGRMLGFGGKQDSSDEASPKSILAITTLQLTNPGHFSVFVVHSNFHVEKWSVQFQAAAGESSARIQPLWNSGILSDSVSGGHSACLDVRAVGDHLAFVILDKQQLVVRKLAGTNRTTDDQLRTLKPSPALAVTTTNIADCVVLHGGSNTNPMLFICEFQSDSALQVAALPCGPTNLDAAWVPPKRVAVPGNGDLPTEAFPGIMQNGDSTTSLVLVAPSSGTFACELVGNQGTPQQTNSLPGPVSAATSRPGPGTPAPKNRTRNSRLPSDEVVRMLDRMLRTFFQESSHGKNGLAIVSQDKDFEELDRLTPLAINEAVRQIAQKEVDRRPAQRWAEQRSEDRSFVQSFVPDLVQRDVNAKRDKLSGPFGLVKFLTQVGLADELTQATRQLIVDLDSKLVATMQACKFQQSNEQHETSAQFNEFLVAAMQNVLMGRLRCEDAQQVSEQLRLLGVPITDMFYSQATQIMDILPAIQQVSNDAFCDLVNQLFLAVLRSTFSTHMDEFLHPNGTGERGAHPDPLVVPWADPRRDLAPLLAQVRAAGQVLKTMQTQSHSAASCWQFASQYAELTDVALANVRYGDSQDEAIASTLEALKDEFITPLIALAESLFQSAGSGSSMNETIEAIGLLSWDLGIKYVHFEPLVRFCSLESRLHDNDGRGIQRLERCMNQSHVSKLVVRDVKVDATVARATGRCVTIQGTFGHFLVCQAPAEQTGQSEHKLCAVAEQESDKAATQFLIVDQGNGKCLVQSVKHGVFLSLRTKGLGFVSTPDGQSCVVQCSEVEGGRATQLELGGAFITVDQLGEVTIGSQPGGEWSSFPQYVFQWCLNTGAPHVICSLVANGKHTDDLKRFLSNVDVASLDNEQSVVVVRQLGWVLGLQMGDLEAAARELAAERTHTKSARMAQTLGSLEKLALWAQ